MPKPPGELNSFQSLCEVVRILRSPEGCPWDRAQTHPSLSRNAIEEAHELVEAIEIGADSGLQEELGDVLLQVVLHAQIASERGAFDMGQVIEGLNSKLVRRHEHVFGDKKVGSSDEAMQTWEKAKEKEKANSPHKSVRPFDVPLGMPALARAEKLGQKSKKYNFDWKGASQVLEKVEEEFGELREAIESGNLDEQNHEMGDLLFSLAQYARHLGLDPEQALRQTNTRFESRFSKMQELAGTKELGDKSADELESLWGQAKKILAAKL